MFEHGEYVVCIQNEKSDVYYKNLTIGNIYEVLSSSIYVDMEQVYILITSDVGKLHSYNSKLFIRLNDYRNEKINDILK